MENMKVKVESLNNGPVGVNVPALNFKREWPARGFKVPIDYNVLEELIYDDGFRYMIENGILGIEDMDVKKALGLEPMDATEPVNIINLTDQDMRHYMVTMPMEEFKEKIGGLGYEQLQRLADYAIHNRLSHYDKALLIKNICGRDIIKAIQLNDADKEE